MVFYGSKALILTKAYMIYIQSLVLIYNPNIYDPYPIFYPIIMIHN